MVTINNSDGSYEKKNIIINDWIYSLLDLYKQKQIGEKELKYTLISHAKSSGFIDNKCRKQAWSLLIESPDDQYSTGRV
jgi:hypothetical protein